MNHVDKLKENEQVILSLLAYRKNHPTNKIDNEINRIVKENDRIKEMKLGDALTRRLKTIEIKSKINRS